MSESFPEFWESDESELWSSISSGRIGDNDYAMGDDPQAIALFSAGWLEETSSPEMTSAIRDAFFDYAIEEGYFYDREDFDWESFREYLGY